MTSFHKTLRLSQIRATAKILNGLSQFPPFRVTARKLVEIAPLRTICNLLVGYRRPFATFAEATAAAARFLPSHEFEGNIRDHFYLGYKARPSDYAALFYLRALIDEVITILDIGGSVGNLFYCYSQYLTFPAPLRWIVCDLPKTIAAGEQIASERSESRLVFISSPVTQEKIDLLMVSGSMHYFEEPLSKLISELPAKPKHILINRTPLVSKGTAYTVQDGVTHLVACKLLSVEAVTLDLTAAGYVLVDTWNAFELSLKVPFYPDLSAPFYTGMYWRYQPN